LARSVLLWIAFNNPLCVPVHQLQNTDRTSVKENLLNYGVAGTAVRLSKISLFNIGLVTATNCFSPPR
jgi:hypothetical protein